MTQNVCQRRRTAASGRGKERGDPLTRLLLGCLPTGLEQLDLDAVTGTAQSLLRNHTICTYNVPLLHVVVGNASFLLISLPAHLALVRARPIRRSPAPLAALRPLEREVSLKCRQWLARPPPSAAHSRWLSGQRGRRDPDRLKVVGRGQSWGCRRCCWRRRRSRRSRRVKGLPCRGGRGKAIICGAQPALRLQRQRRGGTCT